MSRLILLLIPLSVSSVFQRESCGKFPDGIQLETRIVGGVPTRENEVPWIASIRFGDQHRCGGSLISDRHVLTAAHCVLSVEPWEIEIHLGDWNLTDPSNPHIQSFSVIQIIIHESYKKESVKQLPENDIAILDLDREVILDERIWPICISDGSSEEVKRRTLTASGWGTMSFGGAGSEILRKVDLVVGDDVECRASYRAKNILSTHLCAGYLPGGKDACQGDSGGPLYANFPSSDVTPKWTLMGIVSAGEGCARKGKLGLYTRVSEFINWVDENTGLLGPKKGDSEAKAVETTPLPVENGLSIAVGSASSQPNFISVLFGLKKENTSIGNSHKMSGCMRCICEASTTCSLDYNLFRNPGWIGLFAMGKGYWIDGGSNRVPGDTISSDDAAFKKCALDTDCAVKTVEKYIDRYRKDCNSDGTTDCDDFVRIHRQGPLGCTDPIDDVEYWSNYVACRREGRLITDQSPLQRRLQSQGLNKL